MQPSKKIINTIRKVRQHGLSGSARILFRRIRQNSAYDKWRCRNAPRFSNPTDSELFEIEQAFLALGISIQDYNPARAGFSDFKAEGYFPADYHGGALSGVWEEKLLEHWIAAEKLGLFGYAQDDIYIDVAACGSPWAQELRSRHGISSFAIDLEVPQSFSSLDFYKQEDATRTSFPDSSIQGMSLQCAFEMFGGDDDMKFIREVNRILLPGGRVIILPLYMHTHYCAYSSPEFFGRGYSDENAFQYVNMNAWNVPSSRKYDVVSLKERLLDNIGREGLEFEISLLRNKDEFGEGIYCHFILEIRKPG